MAHDIFISYSSKNKKTADAVCAALEENNMRCWIAPRDITPGKEWGEEIVTAIAQSKIMVLIFSSAANQSQQVLREVERAVNKNVIIVPFRIEDVVPTKSMEYFLYSTHWLDALTPDMEVHIGALVDTVCKVAPIERNVKIEAKKSKQSARPKQKLLIAVAAAITALSLAFGAFGLWMALSSKNNDQKQAAVISDSTGKTKKDIPAEITANTKQDTKSGIVQTEATAPEMVAQEKTGNNNTPGNKQVVIADNPAEKTNIPAKTTPVKTASEPAKTVEVQKTQLKIGDYIKFGIYNGQPVDWIVINLDKNGAPIILTEKIISMKAFDAKEVNSTDEKRKKYGSNDWISSNIREWLNSTEKTVRYSTSPPTKEGTCFRGAYDTEPGFLTGFSVSELKLITPYSHSIILPAPEKDMKDSGTELYSFEKSGIITVAMANFDKAFSKVVHDKVFLLSVKEAKEYVFDRGWNLKAVPTAQAEDRDVSREYNLLKKETEGYWTWWLSTPCATGSNSVYFADEWGTVMNTEAFLDDMGIRPALYLSASKLDLKGTGTKDDPYVLNEQAK